MRLIDVIHAGRFGAIGTAIVSAILGPVGAPNILKYIIQLSKFAGKKLIFVVTHIFHGHAHFLVIVCLVHPSLII